MSRTSIGCATTGKRWATLSSSSVEHRYGLLFRLAHNFPDRRSLSTGVRETRPSVPRGCARAGPAPGEGDFGTRPHPDRGSALSAPMCTARSGAGADRLSLTMTVGGGSREHCAAPDCGSHPPRAGAVRPVGLSHLKPFGGSTEMQFLRDHDEGADLIQGEHDAGKVSIDPKEVLDVTSLPFRISTQASVTNDDPPTRSHPAAAAGGRGCLPRTDC